jgi:hypothetical protein
MGSNLGVSHTQTERERDILDSNKKRESSAIRESKKIYVPWEISRSSSFDGDGKKMATSLLYNFYIESLDLFSSFSYLYLFVFFFFLSQQTPALFIQKTE